MTYTCSFFHLIRPIHDVKILRTSVKDWDELRDMMWRNWSFNINPWHSYDWKNVVAYLASWLNLSIRIVIFGTRLATRWKLKRSCLRPIVLELYLQVPKKFMYKFQFLSCKSDIGVVLCTIIVYHRIMHHHRSNGADFTLNKIRTMLWCMNQDIKIRFTFWWINQQRSRTTAGNPSIAASNTLENHFVCLIFSSLNFIPARTTTMLAKNMYA